MIAIPSAVQFQPHHADLVFSEEDHSYRLKSGEILSSVTSILKSEGIQTYGPRNSAADFAMQVGTWVHQAIAWYERGTLDESTLSEGIRPYLESYKRLKILTGLTPIISLIEVPLWHSAFRYSGTPDIPGYIDGRFTVCDLKCGSKRQGDKVQVSAYGKLVQNSVVGFGNIHAEGLIVYLQDSGSMPKLEPVSADEMFQNEDVFIAALKVNRWKSSHGMTP